MARKVILDVDPGIDDAVALALALFDPRLEVVAVTASGGNVPPQQASRNVQTIIEQLDPPRWPRVGVAPLDTSLPCDNRRLHGNNGLGDADFMIAELHHQHPAEKVICDEVRAAPEQVTILCLAPLTNLAAALQRDPELAGQIGQVVIRGGTFGGPGNVTPAAEFNMYCNPAAAQTVFRAPLTTTLVPLDVTRRLVMTYDHADQLPGERTRTGAFLSRILPYSFRSHHQLLGQEGIHLHDAVGLIAALRPELFETVPYYGEVETAGELTAGATIFDRRPLPENQANMEVALAMDGAAVLDVLLRGLNAAS